MRRADVRSVEPYDRLTREGVAAASDHVTTMTGIDTEVEVTGLSSVPVGEAPRAVGDEPRHGTVFELEGDAGYLVVLFDGPSAERIADAAVPMDTGDGFGDVDRSALTEVCTVMTSGFVDGLATALGPTADRSPPEFVSAPGSAVLDLVTARLGRAGDRALVVDARVRLGGNEGGCDVCVLPVAGTLAALDADGTGEFDGEASFVPAGDGDP